MTTALASIKTARTLLVIAAGFVALAFGLWGVERGVAAAIGAGLSVLNWLALRWLTGRIVSADGPGKSGASLLLVGKMGVLMAVVYILIQRLHVDPIGLAFGLGVLFIGPVVTGLVGSGQPAMNAAGVEPAAVNQARAQAAISTREER